MSAARKLIRRIEPALQQNGFAYTFLFAYALVNVLMFLHGAVLGWNLAITPKNPKPPVHVLYVSALARGGGALLNLNSVIVIIVAAKALMTYLRRTVLNMIVPFDKAMPAFHSIVGNVLGLGTVIHVVFQSANFALFRLVWKKRYPGFNLANYVPLLVTGIILVVVLFVMRVTAMTSMRKRKFELFWTTHNAGFTLYYVVLMAHGFHAGKPSTYKYVVAPLAIYGIDCIMRFQRDKGSRLLLSRAALTPKGDDMTCVTLPRTFNYMAGQYCELKLPYISRFEWHPFTIASSPHESKMMFFVKKNGDWTEKLYNLATAKKNEAPPYIDVLVRGPYGAPAQHVGQYEHVVLISGGVGATPFASITKYAHHWISTYTPRVTHQSQSVSAAFSRNVSTCNVSASVPSTPTTNRSADASRDASRNHSMRGFGSRNLSRNLSRNMSRNQSRSGSRPRSRPLSRIMSRSGSESVLFRNNTDASVDSVANTISEQRNILRNTLFNSARPTADVPEPYSPIGLGRGVPHDYNEDLGDPNAPIPDRFAPSPGTSRDALIGIDDLGDPNGPIPDRFTDRTRSAGRSRDGLLGVNSLGMLSSYAVASSDDDAPRSDRARFIDSPMNSRDTLIPIASSDDEVPDRYTERTGPFSAQFSSDGLLNSARMTNFARHSSDLRLLPDGRPMLEAVREYDSSRSLFSDSDEDKPEVVEEETPVDDAELEEWEAKDESYRRPESIKRDWTRRRGDASPPRESEPKQRRDVSVKELASRKDDEFSVPSSLHRPDLSLHDIGFGELDIDLELGGIQLEDEILREQSTASSAYNLLGVSYGSAALLRYLQCNEEGTERGSQIRATMSVMDLALSRASWQDRLMFYLHTVTLNWALLWVMITRLSLIGVAAILDRGRHIYESRAFGIVDLVLTVLLLVPVVTAMVVEIGTRGLKAYLVDEVGNIFEMLVLVPLLVCSIILTGYLTTTTGEVPETFVAVVVYAVWVLTTALLLWRTGRTIGHRVSLAQYFKSTHSQTKSLDFMWVSKAHADDQWLINELLPLAGSGIVRLHRFITRETPVTEPWMLDYERVPLKTTYRRPDWDDVFSSLVERSRSGTVIGVFFCGPDVMARAVQQSAMRAMAASVENAMQRGYVETKRGPAESGDKLTRSISVPDKVARKKTDGLGGGLKSDGNNSMLKRVMSTGKTMMRALSSRRGMADRKETNDSKLTKADFGCNVRISVRIENFT